MNFPGMTSLYEQLVESDGIPGSMLQKVEIIDRDLRGMPRNSLSRIALFGIRHVLQ